MNKLLIMKILSNSHYGYNPEYEYTIEKENDYYINYIDKCLSIKDKYFNDACKKIILFLLEFDTIEELNNEEFTLKKEKLLSRFNQEYKNKLESFMYACTKSLGIYSEEKKQVRNLKKEYKM